MSPTDRYDYMDKEWVQELQAECLDDDVRRWELYCCFELGRDVGEGEGIRKVAVRAPGANPFSLVAMQDYQGKTEPF